VYKSSRAETRAQQNIESKKINFFMDLKTLLEADVENCFPTIPRQLVLDMVAGTASADYPNTPLSSPYKKGAALPSHPFLSGSSTYMSLVLWSS
jgi:hypothetical protein